MIFLSRCIAVFLTPLMVSLPLECQLPASHPTDDSVSAAALQIRVVPPPTSDAGALVQKTITVEVLDAAGAAVPKAAVVLRFPEAESSPVFPDSTHSAVLYTNENGRATSREIKWTADAKPVSVRITAAKGEAHAGILYQATSGPARTASPPAASAPAKPVEEQPAAERPFSPLPSVAEAPRPHVMITTGKQPGTLPTSAAYPQTNQAVPEIDENTNIPIRHVIASDSDSQPDGHPGVSITHSGDALESTGGHSKMKWIAILALAGGAGAALAFVNKGKSSSTSSSSTSIGTPTVSLGHP